MSLLNLADPVGQTRNFVYQAMYLHSKERWDGRYGEWFVVVNRFETKVSTINVSLQLDTAGGTGVISSLVARMAAA